MCYSVCTSGNHGTTLSNVYPGILIRVVCGCHKFTIERDNRRPCFTREVNHCANRSLACIFLNAPASVSLSPSTSACTRRRVPGCRVHKCSCRWYRASLFSRCLSPLGRTSNTCPRPRSMCLLAACRSIAPGIFLISTGIPPTALNKVRYETR